MICSRSTGGVAPSSRSDLGSCHSCRKYALARRDAGVRLSGSRTGTGLQQWPPINTGRDVYSAGHRDVNRAPQTADGSTFPNLPAWSNTSRVHGSLMAMINFRHAPALAFWRPKRAIISATRSTQGASRAALGPTRADGSGSSFFRSVVSGGRSRSSDYLEVLKYSTLDTLGRDQSSFVTAASVRENAVTSARSKTCTYGPIQLNEPNGPEDGEWCAVRPWQRFVSPSRSRSSRRQQSRGRRRGIRRGHRGWRRASAPRSSSRSEG
jgi:hypothetical protein